MFQQQHGRRCCHHFRQSPPPPWSTANCALQKNTKLSRIFCTTKLCIPLALRSTLKFHFRLYSVFIFLMNDLCYFYIFLFFFLSIYVQQKLFASIITKDSLLRDKWPADPTQPVVTGCRGGWLKTLSNSSWLIFGTTRTYIKHVIYHRKTINNLKHHHHHHPHHHHYTDTKDP